MSCWPTPSILVQVRESLLVCTLGARRLQRHVHLMFWSQLVDLMRSINGKCQRRTAYAAQVLMIKFRGAFRAMLLSQLNRGELLPPPGTASLTGAVNCIESERMVWNVKLFDRYARGSGVATYLAQYMRGRTHWQSSIAKVKTIGSCSIPAAKQRAS